MIAASICLLPDYRENGRFKNKLFNENVHVDFPDDESKIIFTSIQQPGDELYRILLIQIMNIV